MFTHPAGGQDLSWDVLPWDMLGTTFTIEATHCTYDHIYSNGFLIYFDVFYADGNFLSFILYLWLLQL